MAPVSFTPNQRTRVYRVALLRNNFTHHQP